MSAAHPGEQMNLTLRHYLLQAKKFYQAATGEFLSGRKSGDEIKIRQSAEKGRGAVVQATNALLTKWGFKIPKGARKSDIFFIAFTPIVFMTGNGKC